MPKIITDNASSADNQQGTLRVSNFYYTGFCVGELSCSVIRATDKRGRGFYFMPDITISNADLDLLKEINSVISSNQGNISPIKGGYNLKFRGKRKVELVLQFFSKYPVITGDLAKRKLELLNGILPAIGRYSKVQDNLKVIEKCREDLRDLKLNCYAKKTEEDYFKDNKIGFFLAGIIDAEGSCGLKKSGLKLEPYFAVAMKDQKIIYLIQDFLNCGNIRKRSNDGLYHFETNRKSEILRLIEIFTTEYPSKLKKMKEKMRNLKRTLNDYTPSPAKSGDDIV